MKRTGPDANVKKELKDFTVVHLYDKLNLNIVPDTSNWVEVKGGENLIGLISTEIKNGELTLKNNNKANWTRSYERQINIDLHAKDLRHIKFYGSGNITSSTTIKSDTLEVEMFKASGSIHLDLDVKVAKCGQHTGPADLTYTGRANEVFVYSGGNGIIHTDKLITDNCMINNSGTGDFYVNANRYLEVQIYYIGNVFYDGSPSLIYKSIKGDGELKKIQ